MLSILDLTLYCCTVISLPKHDMYIAEQEKVQAKCLRGAMKSFLIFTTQEGFLDLWHWYSHILNSLWLLLIFPLKKERKTKKTFDI